MALASLQHGNVLLVPRACPVRTGDATRACVRPEPAVAVLLGLRQRLAARAALSSRAAATARTGSSSGAGAHAPLFVRSCGLDARRWCVRAPHMSALAAAALATFTSVPNFSSFGSMCVCIAHARCSRGSLWAPGPTGVSEHERRARGWSASVASVWHARARVRAYQSSHLSLVRLPAVSPPPQQSWRLSSRAVAPRFSSRATCLGASPCAVAPPSPRGRPSRPTSFGD